MLEYIVLGVAAFAAGFAVSYSYLARKGSLEEERIRKEAEEILGKARKESEIIIKDAQLKAKDIVYQAKAEMEKELERKKRKIAEEEKKLVERERALDKRESMISFKEKELSKREEEVRKEGERVEELKRRCEELEKKLISEIEEIAQMTREEAKERLIKEIEREAKLEAAKKLRRMEEEIREIADKKAKEIIATAIQRYSGDYVAEHTVSVVNLPSEDMKGRIIGREGRNIRAFEASTGVNIIIDDTPEAVVITSFNPLRREIARMALEKLIKDGRIHPGRIEEVVEKTKEEFDRMLREYGEQAQFDLNLHGIHPELLKLIGSLKYRTSYGQNIYQHSMEVAYLAGMIASELGVDPKLAKRAGLLHDIGKAVDHEVGGSHAKIGAELAKKYGENEKVVHAILAHHEEEPVTDILDIIIQAADAISGARPGARRETLETYLKRLEDLEKIAYSFPGVEKAYAIHAGREIRVIVESESVSDDEAFMLSRDIAKKIEETLSYPGQIKVTVIREVRAVEYAL